MFAAIPTSCGLVALLEALCGSGGSGGTATANGVARLLGDRQAGAAVSLAKLIQRGLAFGFGWRGRLLYFGPFRLLFNLLTFAVMWWVFDANRADCQGLFQSGWFVVGLLTQAQA